MAEAFFQESQLTMARYLRDPGHQPPPPGVEARRLKIYEELIYNNIEGFISGGFPVLRSLYNEAEWQGLVRAFIDQHRCQTPYFLQISEEFLEFLVNNFEARPCDPPFIAELAHYEWVELALDVSEEEVSSVAVFTDVLAIVPRLPPLAWPLSYQFPVHRIGPGFKPTEAAQPVYLLVYRTNEDDVRFMELNVTTARLLEMIRVNDGATARDLLARLAGELDMAEDAVLAFGAEQLTQLIDQSVVVA